MLHTQSEDALRELDEKIWNAQTQAQKRRILVDSDQERSVRSKLNEDITGNADQKSWKKRRQSKNASVSRRKCLLQIDNNFINSEQRNTNNQSFGSSLETALECYKPFNVILIRLFSVGYLRTIV